MSTFNTLVCLFTLMLVGTMPLVCPLKMAAQDVSRSGLRDTIRHELAKDEEDRDALKNVFQIGDASVPILGDFLHSRDSKVAVNAARALAFIGSDKGLEALRAQAIAVADPEVKSAILYFLAGNAAYARSRPGKELLQRLIATAIKDPDDEDVALPAISAALALALSGDPNSFHSVEQVEKLNLMGVDEVHKALEWLRGQKSDEGGVTVGQEAEIKHFILASTFFGNSDHDETTIESVTFDRLGSKALAEVQVRGNEYARGYDLVTVRENRSWRATGVWLSWVSKVRTENK